MIVVEAIVDAGDHLAPVNGFGSWNVVLLPTLRSSKPWRGPAWRRRIFATERPSGVISAEMLLFGIGVVVPGNTSCVGSAEKSPLRNAVVGIVVRERISWRIFLYSTPAEEEQLALLNRAADRAAVVVEPQLALARGEEVLRIELVVAEVFEQTAAELVGAALGHDVDRRAGVAAVFRREVRRLQLHFLDEVDADVVDHRAVAAGGQVDTPSTLRLFAPPRLPLIACVPVPRLVVAASGLKSVSVSPDQRRELQVVAGVERQVLHLRAVDHAGDFAGRAVDRPPATAATSMISMTPPTASAMSAVRRPSAVST